MFSFPLPSYLQCFQSSMSCDIVFLSHRPLLWACYSFLSSMPPWMKTARTSPTRLAMHCENPHCNRRWCVCTCRLEPSRTLKQWPLFGQEWKPFSWSAIYQLCFHCLIRILSGVQPMHFRRPVEFPLKMVELYRCGVGTIQMWCGCVTHSAQHLKRITSLKIKFLEF